MKITNKIKMLLVFVIIVLLGIALLIKVKYEKPAYNKKQTLIAPEPNRVKKNNGYSQKESSTKPENLKLQKANNINTQTIPEDKFKVQNLLEDLFEFDNKRGPDYWQNISVIKIENSNDFREFLKDFYLTNKEIAMSSKQHHELITSMENMCFAFNEGKFSTFAAFRLPAEYKIKPEVTKWHKDRLINQMKFAKKDIPEDPLEIWMLYWEEKNKTSQSFKNFWLAVGTPSVTLKTYYALPMELMEREDILGHRTYAPAVSVNFKRSATNIIREEGKLLCADIEIVVNHITDLTYPVTVRSYWDSKVEKWIPMELILAYTGQGRLIDPDF